MFHFTCHSWMFRDTETVLQTMSPKTRIEKNRILWMFKAICCKRTMIARGNFCIKNYPIQSSFETHKQIFQSLSATQEKKRNIVSDCKSIGRKEPSFNILFLAKNIVDPCEIYMDGICKWSLTTGLRFIGYVGIGKFFAVFWKFTFFRFSQQKMLL